MLLGFRNGEKSNGGHHVACVTVSMGCDWLIIGNFTTSNGNAIVTLPWKLASSRPDEVNDFSIQFT
jgi:hypothetical protein